MVPSPLEQRTRPDCTTIPLKPPDQSLHPERWVFPQLDDIGRSEFLGVYWIRDLVEERSLGPGCCTRLSAGEIDGLRKCTGGSDASMNKIWTIGWFARWDWPAPKFRPHKSERG